MKSGVSLQQMLTEVKRQSESKEDYLIAPNRLRMESYGKEMFLHLSDDSGTELIEPMTITGIAHAVLGCVVGCAIGLPLSKSLYDFLIAGHFPSAVWQFPITSLGVILLFVSIAAIAAVYAPAKRIRNMSITATINEL